MQGKKNDDDGLGSLIVGVHNIAAVWGESAPTVLRKAARGELPVTRLGHVLIADRKQLLAARAAREASGSKRRREALEPARELEEAV
ncbi:MAG: hypothetical protein WA733_21810 [Methylocystis sp.]